MNSFFLLPFYQIFWRKWAVTKKVFYIQGKVIIIMSGTKRKVCCSDLLGSFNILPFSMELLLLMSSFVLKTWTSSDVGVCGISSGVYHTLSICKAYRSTNTGALTAHFNKFFFLLYQNTTHYLGKFENLHKNSYKIKYLNIHLYM